MSDNGSASLDHGATAPQNGRGNWVARLRRFSDVPRTVEERCELCSAPIEPAHEHLIEPTTRRLACACTPCALLFASPEAKRYRRVPRTVTRIERFAITDAQWDALAVPIDLAFFFVSSHAGRVIALYPGPAGATESTLELASWEELARANPELAELEADVEALLVNRTQGAREYYRVPIDRCYELVGAIRRNWHGLSGGEGVREAVPAFFAALERAASPRGAASHA